MMVALGTAMMVLGAAIDVLDLSVCAIASMLVVFVYLEIGSYYPWLVWICTALASALIYPGSIIWAEYLLVFGIYPLIKAYIEKLPKWSWLLFGRNKSSSDKFPATEACRPCRSDHIP